MVFDPIATAAVIAAFAAVIIILQLLLLIQQQRTTRRQLALIEKHEALLARASLSVEASLRRPDPEDARFRIEFVARNEGTRSADDVLWHLYVPLHLAGAAELPGYQDEDVEIDGRRYKHYTGRRREPIYPRRSLPLGKVTLALPGPQQGIIFWKLSADDGEFPREGPGRIDVSIGPVFSDGDAPGPTTDLPGPGETPVPTLPASDAPDSPDHQT